MVKKKLNNLFFVISIISMIVTICASVIFILDISNAKGLIPLIFLSLTVYFLMGIFSDISEINFKKSIPIDVPVVLFLLLSIFGSIISIYVFWV